MIKNKIPFYKQLNKIDCAPTCLRMLIDFYEISNNYSLEDLRTLCRLDNEGTSVHNFNNALNKIGIESNIKLANITELVDVKLPVILFVNGNHYIIVEKIKNNNFYITNPASGKEIYNLKELLDNWILEDEKGILIEINYKDKPREKHRFFDEKGSEILSFKSLFKKVLSYKKGVRQVSFLLILASIIQLIIPFLTSSIVDVGIENKDTGFITIILLAQLALFISSTSMEFLRSWIVLHIGLRLNIDLSTSFAKSILNKSITYFENKQEGDFLQRIIDNNRIEGFFTNTFLSMFVAVLNLVLFGIVLLIYNLNIFITFLIATGFSIFWIYLFLKKRKKLDNERFKISSKSRTELLEIINGVEDIKLNNLESSRLDRWVVIQEKLLTIRMKMLEIAQFQRGGAMSINQGKNILITFLSALAVINGNMTIGEMLAVQYIIGQLNSPVREIVRFIQSYQDAELSLERISDVIDLEKINKLNKPEDSNNTIPSLNKKIELKSVNLKRNNKFILSNINILIPYGTKIGIVGQSGSGKTTLLKAILRLYKTDGEILLGKKNITFYDKKITNTNFTAVLHDSHIFSDSVKYNITLETSADKIDFFNLKKVIKMCELKDLIFQLPYKLNTKIGKGGNNLSRGQQQRIIIARALYKDASYLIFDEFTNYLDNITKKRVLSNIYKNFNDKTIISVSHKVNDLKNSDYIYYMEEGKIIEEGTPEELLDKKGKYFNLYLLENEN